MKLSEPTTNPAVFDAFAPTYDADFTQTRLGQMLRGRVWQILERAFTPGDHILELACGTGEDALRLAQRGIQVTATDGSAEMIQATRLKAQRAGVENLITAEQYSFQDFVSSAPPQSPIYDGLFSNFGGLNTIGEWRPLAQSLAQWVKPGGKAVLVPMGPVCPWETGWYLLHGRFSKAVRRFKKVSQAKIGSATIPIWYPSARQLKAAFRPWFRHLETRSLGFWLPPSYLDHLVNRWPNLFGRLNTFEAATARLTWGWGDHYIICFERLSNE
jgi:SAM-dependent methyltransferase